MKHPLLAAILFALVALYPQSEAQAFCIYNDSGVTIIVKLPDYESSVAPRYLMKPRTKECYTTELVEEFYTVELYLRPRDTDKQSTDEVAELELLCKERVLNTGYISLKGILGKTSCTTGGT